VEFTVRGGMAAFFASSSIKCVTADKHKLAASEPHNKCNKTVSVSEWLQPTAVTPHQLKPSHWMLLTLITEV